jgi:hypothetical protein
MFGTPKRSMRLVNRDFVTCLGIASIVGLLLYLYYPFPSQPPISMSMGPHKQREAFIAAFDLNQSIDSIASNGNEWRPCITAGIVRISTAYGMIRIKLRPDGAPHHV